MESKHYTNPEHCIQGICCQVNNCYYNDKNHRCTAKEIKIGPQFASCTSETICSTFKPQ